MLRAVRFAAGFDFAIDAATAAAVREMAPQITVVSPERIAMEMRRVLTESGRVRGIRLLVELGLAPAVLPEIVPGDDGSRARADRALAVLGRLEAPHFPLALAAVLAPQGDAAVVREAGLRWKLSNKETDEAAWLVEHRDALAGARSLRWSRLQPLLAHPWAASLAALHEAFAPGAAEDVAYCRQWFARPREELDPPPLVTGEDLHKLGLRPGPKFKIILQAVRDAQLDGEARTRDEALKLAAEIARRE